MCERGVWVLGGSGCTLYMLLCCPSARDTITKWSVRNRHESWGVFGNKTNGPVCMCE